ncbi:MAG: SPOR domain-containing protein [Phenylobacterium sp.]|uniref:cell division protein FtsN n=1 Tax=Phenylobacterium sp. TaxID=1871053 RepID=UPI002723D740|nr:SPOR domain-containing protein [Phenylobacterium sp.]MDO8912839.1 SPOR domain-containing protein [Phenylobacterium sp.]MDP3101561.1 SPOR domain-containing protein [Phenylobacterium sp.]MDP3634525.1 SPOR domain-containing protein [Phenylobacterium sp.]
MTNPDRGAYTPPTDAPLSFDARQPVRGTRPAPMMLIVSALVLIGLVVAIVVFYRSGVRQAGAAPQAVGAPVGAIKGPAPAEAQPVDPAAGLQIYQSTEGGDAPTAPNFTPPPEQPVARQPAPAVVVTPAAKPAPIPPQVVAKPQQTGPVAALPITPDPKPVPALKPSVPAPAVGGAASVQIGAFSSSALADKGWSDAARIAPGATAGKGKRVEAIQKDGATLYRTAVTGFASRADATAFCDQLKAAGKSCFVK